MTTRQEIARKVNIAYFEVYLQRRLPSGDYESDWTDISRYVTGGSKSINYTIDSNDFDIGIFTITSVSLTLSNADGKFADVTDSRSYWASFDSRHLSRIRIDAGYRDIATLAKISEVAFHGLINEQALATEGPDDISVTLMSREYAFKTLDVVGGTFNSPVSCSQAILAICSRSEIVAQITVSAANINPGNDVLLDTPTALVNRKMDEVLGEILLVSNSVMFIDNAGNLIVKSRTESLDSKYAFRLNASDRRGDNVYSLSNFSNGRHRVKNVFAWSGNTALSAASNPDHQRRYGITKKVVGSAAITNTAVIQAALNALVAEWQFPKKEFEIETDYLANEVGLFDLVTIDARPTLDRNTNLPICGTAVAGSDQCTKFVSGLYLTDAIGFKVIALRHDLAEMKTHLKLREKGITLTDGYFAVIITKHTNVTFVAEATKDIDVSSFGMDSTRTMVEILDVPADYETVTIGVTRPNTGTVRLTAGGPVSGTYRILLTQVED